MSVVVYLQYANLMKEIEHFSFFLMLKIWMLLWVENLFKKNPLQDLLSNLNAVISTNESTRIITGHVIYDPAYTYKFQLKTIQV